MGINHLNFHEIKHWRILEARNLNCLFESLLARQSARFRRRHLVHLLGPAFAFVTAAYQWPVECIVDRLWDSSRPVSLHEHY